MARPKTKIDLGELEKLCSMQCTDEEIAAFFGVSNEAGRQLRLAEATTAPGGKNVTRRIKAWRLGVC